MARLTDGSYQGGAAGQGLHARAKKAADRVDDNDRVFRVRKQLNRMIQTASDILNTYLMDTVNQWPSLDQSPQFDVSMIDACVGCDDYRHHLSMLQWAANQISKIATQNTQNYPDGKNRINA